MARTVLPIAGAVIGFWIGGPAGAQWGYAAGSLVSAAIPNQVQGPRIGETGAQTSMEGAQRAIIYGTAACTGNVIASGPLIKRDVEESQGKGGTEVAVEHAYRSFAVRVCEGPIAAYLRVWEDDKLVFDMRATSTMVAESIRWARNVVFYLGDEEQLPDPTLQMIFGNDEVPAHRGSAYIVKIEDDLTDRRGSIPQFRFEVAQFAERAVGDVITGPTTITRVNCLTVDNAGRPMFINEMTGSAEDYTVGFPGQYNIKSYTDDFSLELSTVSVSNVGDGGMVGDRRLFPVAMNEDGHIISAAGNPGTCELIANGALVKRFKPSSGASDSWWFGFAELKWGKAWFHEASVFIGANTLGAPTTAWNRVMKFSTIGSDYPVDQALNIDPSNNDFLMHVSRQGVLRTFNSVGSLVTYDDTLAVLSTGAMPGSTAIVAFGADDAMDLLVTSRDAGIGDGRIAVFRNSTGAFIAEFAVARSSGTTLSNGADRIVFSDSYIYVEMGRRLYAIEAAALYTGESVKLSAIVSDIHDRCGFPSGKFDVTPLTDDVSGLVLAGEYSGADAINTLRSLYLFDRADYDKKIHYPKRGGAVVYTLTIDDLVEEPDTSRREQAIEYPKKLHLGYQNAVGGYAVAKATSSRSSPDVRVVGETTVQVPVVLNPDQAAQAAAILHKVAYAEAEGEVKLSIPDSFLRFVPSNCIGVALRGRVSRLRIEQMDVAAGVIELTLRYDRQSAYTSNVTGVPIPEPTPPPPTIVGETVLAVLDMSARVDSEDDLHYLVAVSGGMPAWNGAAVQRSLDGGATYTTATSTNRAAIMGSLVTDLAAASEHFTDTTNVIRVQLFRDSQTIEDLTEVQFRSEGGAFVIQRPDGSCEVLQYRDADEVSPGVFDLSHLHRGQLNSGASSHLAGALLVGLARAIHVDAQSAWIGAALTHRAVSFGESPETADEQTETYVGRSQIEWPVAYLSLARSGGTVSATWTPRHRFGTEDAPLESQNFRGYRVTLDDGVLPAVTFDTTTPSLSYDASALGSPLTVSVSALNRITGAGPSTSGAI